MSYARQAVTRLTLNMALPDAQGSFSCTLGDVNRRLEVTLIDHGEPFALPPDWTAFLAGVKPDGTRLANSCVVDRGRIIYDFSGGAEIATCPGVFAVVFEVYDELGELVATPKVWVHVADNAGARIVNSADQFSVLSELIGRINGAQEDANDLKVKVEALMDKAASAGTVTIPMSEWTDAAPTMASVAVSGVDAGSIILMIPANEETRLTANSARLSAYPVAFAPVGGDSSVSIFRAEAETIPDSDMTFAYIVLKTGFSFATPVAAIVGVDAYGEGGGGSGGGGSVDPEIVNQVLVAASAAQTSAENAATSAEAANTAKSAAETAAERAEAAAERAESAGGAGGGGESEYTGSLVIDWKDSRLGMGNTNGDYFTNGAQIDVYPANERTYRLASEIGLYVYMVADHTSNDVIIFGLDDGAEVPDETMTFNFNVTDTGTDDLPVATLHPEWSGSGGGSADEATIDAKIAGHNTANDSHQDIRLMIKEHEEAVNALLNSDDETLNETKEIVAYIKSNKSLIDAITTSKVNVSDIIDNLTTNVTNKPLSAAQGVALKALIDGLQSGKLNATDLTSAINTALAQAKASGEFDGKDGKSAYAYAKDGGYGGTEEEFAAKLAKDNPTMANYAFAPVPQLPANGQKEGDVIGGSGGGLEPDFENAIDPANCLLNQRISSSGSIKTDGAAGDVTTDYIPATSSDEIFVNLPLANFNEDYSRVKFYTGDALNGYNFVPSADARLGTQFTVTEENGYCRFKLNTYNGTALGATYTAIRLVLHINTTTITEADIAGLIVTVNQPITYTEIPAEGETAKVSADFDGNNIKAQDIYDYMDKLVAKYPRLITKEVMGKDASGKYNWCRYVFGRRAYDAWVRPDKPAMYAWVNGSTTIYSVSVSPRIGDTLYSTAYIGTVKGTVTAVSNANQTRTVGGVVYTRDKTKDIEPTLVYTETAYSPNYIGTYQGLKNEVTRDNNGVKNKVGTITAMSGNSMTCTDGYTYTRYPLGDRDESYRMKPTILLGANEHGLESDGSGDASEPAIITARLAKDLCECDPRHTYLNMLRDKYQIVLVPIINPYGFTVGKYTNSNNVNIDRNFDTPGWGKDSVDTRHGAYGGSENETQYWMNTCVASKAVVGMANHSYGRKIDSSTGEIVVAGTCGCLIPRPVDAYNEYIEHIEMVMTAYNLSLLFSNSAEPENHAKTRSYMDWVGIRCCALEMQASEGFLLHGGGQTFTPRVMEADYTLLLQFLYMLIDNVK